MDDNDQVAATFRLKKTLLQTVDAWCHANDATRSQFFRKAILNHMKEANKRIDETLASRQIVGRRPRIYLSGSMRAASEQEKSSWRNKVIAEYSDSFEFLDPCRRGMLSTNPQVVELDKRDIDLADGLLVYLTRYSAGTICELFLAYTTDKVVVVVAPDKDFHTDVWITCHSSYVCSDLADGMAFLEKKLLIKSKERIYA